VKKTRQDKKASLRSDPIGTEKARVPNTGTNRQTELIKLVAAMIVADEQRGAAIGVLPSHFELRSTRRLTRASGGFV
jgi:hypothetical protein